MARIARSDAGIARSDLFARIAIGHATGQTFKAFQRMITANPETFATTTRDRVGGTALNVVKAAMLDSQNGKCILCTRTLNTGKRGAAAEFFILIPSCNGGRDFEAGDMGVANTGYMPGNAALACALCSDRRNAYMAATGYAVCFGERDASYLPLGDKRMGMILMEWPKGAKAIGYDDDVMTAKCDAFRMAEFGF